ncbi:hypothetical protein CRG98_011770 [Punica granatum]|uniref:Uncharacterized protein n=1 Tax=Punica granatum TaxID=22663 RepID=A0A2I0KH36_PUNGR|nr:hypothetical protein CRG98_011770 [Punica granatum]
MQRLRQYTLYHTIRLLSKADPLRYLLDSPSSMWNIAKWRCQLTEYDIEYVPRTSVKGQAIVDHLEEFPVDDDTPINTDFPDEGILQVDEAKEEPTWKMYFDGAVNSVGSGVGAVLISPDGRHYPVTAKVDSSCTNNVAEYEACIRGLQAAIDFKVKELEVFGDSMLTIFQTLGQWKTKDVKLVPYHEYLEELAKNFEKISFTYTPHAKNQFADAVATLAPMATVARFLKRDVIARYGVPATIITDNAKNLNNKVINELCAQFKIQHRNSTPYRPQMNGAVKATNKNIKKIIEKMTVNYKNWHEMLPYALLAYRTSIRTSTGTTPYSLVYGMEAVLPIEVEILSMRILAEAELAEAEWPKQRYEQLNLIDEKRLKALCHGQCKIRNPKGRSPLMDSRLPHAANRAPGTPKIVRECPTPPRSIMLKEERTMGDHYQSPHIRQFEPNLDRATSHSVFRPKFWSYSGPSPSFRSILVTLRSTLVCIWVHPGQSGLGTLGSAHGRVDPPLRIPTNPTSHRAVTGASVPTCFSLTGRGCLPPGSPTRDFKPSLATPTATSPTLLLVHRG